MTWFWCVSGFVVVVAMVVAGLRHGFADGYVAGVLDAVYNSQSPEIQAILNDYLEDDK